MGDDARSAAGAGAVRTAGKELRRGRPLRYLRIPSGDAEAADLLLRGSRRLLSRYPQGPALHRARRFACAPLGAKRALPYRPVAHAAARAHTFLHRTGSVGNPQWWRAVRVRTDL